MAVTRETLRLHEQLRADIAAITDQQVRDLVSAWAQAWDEVLPDLQAALLDLIAGAAGGKVTRSQVLRSQRMALALRLIRANLDELGKDAGIRITADAARILQVTDRAQRRIVASQMPPAEQADFEGWARVDPGALAGIVKRTTQQITALSRPLSRESEAAIRRELVRGIGAGSNPKQVARKIVDRVHGRFNGGLARATTIARTEMLDAHREGARQARIANADVLAGWEWSASLTPRTCRGCWAQDGTLHPVEEPGPNGHQNCRCAAIPRVKSWAELGLVSSEPDSVRSENAAHAAFVALDPSDQRRILTPAGYAAWQAGEYPMSTWSEVRRTDGWRDSIGASRPPSPTQARARRRLTA